LFALGKLQPSAEVGKVLLKTLVARESLIGQDSVLKDAWQIAARNQAAAVASAQRSQSVSGLESWLEPVVARAGTSAPVPDKPAVARKFPIDKEVHERGGQVFSHTCVACHGDDGKGVPGAFPPLDGSDWVTGDPSIPAKIVAHGVQGPIEVSGQKFNSVMPGLSDLSDQEIADVLTYVRQSWSNDAAPVSTDLVKKVRATPRPAPWTADELKK
jgi:mono/diheme cytochrome c family protein